MAIIVTPKGWAIEFETRTDHKTENSFINEIADTYTSVLQSLIQTIQTAQSDNDILNTPDYYTLLLLENMQPTFENAKAMFAAMQPNKKETI